MERLCAHLAPLKLRQPPLVREWHDRKIEPGENWADVIDERLGRSELILLLLSPSFFDSDYITGVELRKALERHDVNDAKVIPILLRDVAWEGTPIARLQALPRNARPVVRWRDRDQALRDVVRGVGRVIEHMTRDEDDSAHEIPPENDQPGYYLNHTSFLREEKQEEFRGRTGVPLDHYDIRVIVDAYDEDRLDEIERVEYILDPAYPEPVKVRTERDRPQNFLLKEIANGEYLLTAKVFLKGQRRPLQINRYITLWESGPELP